jgi:hypothetical protein
MVFALSGARQTNRTRSLTAVSEFGVCKKRLACAQLLHFAPPFHHRTLGQPPLFTAGDVTSQRMDAARESDQHEYADRRQDKKCEQHDGIRDDGV